MASLKFSQEEDRNKYAIGMYAKDGEYVEFNHICDCCGPVSFPIAPSFHINKISYRTTTLSLKQLKNILQDGAIRAIILG